MLRRISKIICVTMVCAIFVLTVSIPIYAKSNKEVSSETCYIASMACPKEYIAYVEENAVNYVLSVDEYLQDRVVTVGTPFSFATSDADVFYFPIICDGVISYLFRVYPGENGFCGVITEFLAADIEEISKITTKEKPLYLQLVGKEIIATVGENEYVLFEYPENMSQQENLVSLCAEEIVSVVDAKQSTNISLDLSNTMSTRVAQRASITIDKSEQQKNNSWCAAYALASIIRTRTSYKGIYAKDCMKDAYGSVPATNVTFPRNKISTVANKYGLNPTVLSGAASNNTLYNQIASGRPVLMSMKNVTGTKSHAVVLRSYNLVNSTWGIWNPWYDFYEWYSMSGTYVPTGKTAISENTYQSYRHAYNF